MLDFKTAKKHFFNISLIDGSVFLVRMPKKKTYEKFTSMQSELKQNPDAALDEVYNVAAEILSNNQQGKVVTSEYCEETFDVEDLQILFNSYGAFIQEAINSPN